MTAQQREEEVKKIKADYEKVINESNEKIHIAEDCYGLVDRYLRKLDQELLKFQLELEADNRGITEILEKKSLEMDASSSSRHNMIMKENRVPKRPKQNQASAFGSSFDRITRRDENLAAAQPSTFPLEQMGAGSTAIAAAASQALAATHYNVQTGRRSNSLKASFEAISQGLAMKDLSIGQELASAATSALAATSTDSQQKRQKIKHKTSGGGGTSGGSSLSSGIGGSGGIGSFGLDVMSGSLLDDVDAGLVVDGGNGITGGISLESPGMGGPVTPGGSQGSDQEWNYDPNEPRYCICNQVSYGDMVACDNEDCPYEWFHYPCVGITDPPKGKWYCAPCTANMKRRGRKF